MYAVAMRLTRYTLIVPIALALVCCVSMPTPAARQDACQEMRHVKRWVDPCGFSRMLAICVGLPEPEQIHIEERCRAEIERLDSELSDVPMTTSGHTDTDGEAQSTTAPEPGVESATTG